MSNAKTKLGITKYSIVTNSNDSVTLRLMTEHDLAMLYEWLNRSHIVEWWGGEEARPTLADVQEQYLPSVLAQESVTPYIAMLNGEPIGYAQSYVALGSGDGRWEEETDPGVRGIDQLLANASQLGKGLGTKLVRALVELLFNDPEVTKIQTDPSPSNLRAIRCYEKAGFERQGTVTLCSQIPTIKGLKMVKDWIPISHDNYKQVQGPFYHGTKANLAIGDLLTTGFISHFEDGRILKHIYFSALMEPAVWGAELAMSLSGLEGRGYIYIVEPTGPFEDDPNLTNKRFPGNPTQSYRTCEPLRIVGVVEDWEGHPVELIRGMLDSLEDLKRRGLHVIED